MTMFGRRILRDADGAVLVEVTVMMTIIFVFVLGSIDFLFAFYQWNMAAKAAEVGARIAAVSAPVVQTDLTVPTGLNTSASSGSPGETLPSYTVICNGGISTCTGCVNNADKKPICNNGYNLAAMQTIVFGRPDPNDKSTNGQVKTTCSATPTSFYYAGMCNMFDRITVAKVKVTYTNTGLGYAGRPGGLVPTITVQLQNIPFQFFFLGGLLGFANINIPAVTTTITGEDLCYSNACS